jgi:hypothetical protein
MHMQLLSSSASLDAHTPLKELVLLPLQLPELFAK